MERDLPLAGVKVLDFTWAMVGPAGIRYLADYGATVVHVESATRIDTARGLQPFKDGKPGAERSALYQNLNAGKLGITLNLTTQEARAVALRLAQWADIVAETYAPKAMRAWGLTYEAIRRVNPGVIMLSSSLNGQTGPHAALAGFGTMGAQLAGFGELAGWPDRPQASPFGAYTDYVAPRFIAVALLAALDHRRRTGEGQYIDLSQVEASLHFLGPALLDYTVNGRIQSRRGNASDEHAPHGSYRCRNDELGMMNDESQAHASESIHHSSFLIHHSDRWIAIACATDAQWSALCAAAGHPEWETDARFATFAARLANRDALDTAIAAWTAEHSVDLLEATLQRAGVPAHRATSSADAFADPQLAARGHFVTVEHPEFGAVPLEASCARFSRTPARPRAAAATFGRDNDYVLREILGMDDEQIVELITSGALD